MISTKFDYCVGIIVIGCCNTSNKMNRNTRGNNINIEVVAKDINEYNVTRLSNHDYLTRVYFQKCVKN
jgi:hypothetical protein